MSATVREILAQWHDVILNGTQAVANRHYELFYVAFHDGCECFNRLKTELESPRRREIIAEHSEEIEQINREWMALSAELQLWMAEIKEQAQNLRKDENVEHRIAGAYGYIRKSGNVLRISR